MYTFYESDSIRRGDHQCPDVCLETPPDLTYNVRYSFFPTVYRPSRRRRIVGLIRFGHRRRFPYFRSATTPHLWRHRRVGARVRPGRRRRRH